MKKIKIIFSLISVLAVLLIALDIFFERDMRYNDHIVMMHAKNCALIILESLKEAKITQLPFESKERVRIIDDSVYKNRVRITEEFNSKYTLDLETPLEPEYPNVNITVIHVSGINKRDGTETSYSYYFLWKDESASYWRGYEIICNLLNSEIQIVHLMDLTDVWVESNIEIFPNKDSKTYTITKKIKH